MKKLISGIWYDTEAAAIAGMQTMTALSGNVSSVYSNPTAGNVPGYQASPGFLRIDPNPFFSLQERHKEW